VDAGGAVLSVPPSTPAHAVDTTTIAKRTSRRAIRGMVDTSLP